MRVGPRWGGAPPAAAVAAGAAGMGVFVLGATGSKAAFAEELLEDFAGVVAFAGVALEVEVFLLELLFAELDFFADLEAVFFAVAAAAGRGNAAVPASVDTSATTRSAVRTRMGRTRVNRRLWRAVNACINADPLTNYVNPTCAHGCARTSRQGIQSPYPASSAMPLNVPDTARPLP